MKIHHIGYFVKNIAKGMKTFCDLGYEVEQDVVRDEYRGIDIAFLLKDGYRVELVSPYTEESVVYDLRKKMGNSPYHICYEVEDIDAATLELRKKHYIVINPKEPTTEILYHKNVVFLFNKNAGILELIEK